MRQKLHIILTLLSCCILLTQSCTSDVSADEQDYTEAKGDSKGDVAAIGDAEEDDDDKPILPIEPVVAPVAPVAPVTPAAPEALLPPPAPLSPWGGGGGGGGGLGNSDIEREHHHPEEPHGKCGDGKQEVLPDSHECKYRLFGSTNNDNGSISLYGFHLRDNGEGKLIGNVTGGLSKIYALDFDPSGQLYGLGVRTSDSAIVYFSLDCRTAVATILGNTDLNTSLSITDMDFDSIGRLFAYVNEGSSPDQLGIIVHVLHVPTTGEYIELGVTGLDDELGNAIASTPFPNDPLYHAGDLSGITILSKSTGQASTQLATISFPGSVSGLSPFINSMDGDPFTNIVYVSFQDSNNDFFIAILDVLTGVVTFVSDDEEAAPSNLNTITVNRRYEECDFNATIPPLPEGTSCTDECQVIESDCEDGIDNDQNGLIDCADPACNNQPCDPHNGCVTNPTCVQSECVGTAFNPCVEIIANECAITTCVPIPDDDDDFYCEVQLDTSKTGFGSCTPSDNCAPESRNPDGTCNDILSICEAGQCAQEEICPVDESPSITCVGQARDTIPATAGICSGGPNNGFECSKDADCPNFIPPVSPAPTCVQTLVLVCSSDSSNPGASCTEDSDCPNGTCIQIGCLDDNPCTADSCLEDVGCEFEILDQVLCRSSDSSCQVGVCQVGNCVDTPTLLAPGTACDDQNDCTTGDTCNVEGVCGGPATVDCTNCPTGQCVGRCTDVLIGYQDCYSDADCIANDSGICDKSAGVCSCAGINSCFVSVCTEGSCTVGDTQLFDGTGCAVGDCNVGHCENSQCVDTEPDNSDCPGCEDNLCAEPLCTGIGCESTLLDGLVPCQVTTSLGACAGFVTCNVGFEQKFCFNNHEPCVTNSDCHGSGCVVFGTCTAGDDVGEVCVDEPDQCPGGGTCAPNCIATQPLNCSTANQ